MKTQNTFPGFMLVIMINIIVLFTSFLSIAQTGGGNYQVGPEMMRAKLLPVATLLTNGKVISFGGREYNFVSCAYADVYDPVANTFSEIPMNFPRDFSAIVKLSDGRYLILGGGKDLGIPAYASTEIYNQVTNSFEAKASMVKERMQPAATQLANGNVLIVGGWYNTDAATYGEVYNLSANTFSVTGALNVPRSDPVVLPTSDGGAIVASGWPSYGGNYFTNVEYYSVTNNSFTVQSAEIIPDDPGWVIPPIDKRTIADCKMNDGKYLLLAYRSIPVSECALLIFDPSTKLFSRLSTSIPLKGTFTDGGFFDVVLNKGDNFAYVLGVDSGYDPQRLAMVTVNLATGQCFQPTSAFALPASEYVFAAMTYIPGIGKILLQGINATNTSYFTGTKKTYLIKPEVSVGINEDILQVKDKIKCYPNPACDFLTIEISGGMQDLVNLRITDVIGKEMMAESFQVSEGVQGKYIYNTTNLSSGLYQLTIYNNRMIKTQSIIIHK